AYNKSENDEQIERLLSNFECESVNIDTSEFVGIIEEVDNQTGVYMYRSFPGIAKGEGLTFSILRKHEKSDWAYPGEFYESKNLLSRIKDHELTEALDKNTEWTFLQNKKSTFAVNSIFEKDLLEIDKV